MSTKLRNPFRMRASEKIESDARFLQIYSPIVLESLLEKESKDKLWGNVLFIHSSPGAGKTSLLRLFEPSTLNTLFNNKSASQYKELFTALKKVGALNEDRIEVLGVTLVCTRNYEILEELGISNAQKIRLFFSLLNARVILATLRAILTLKHKRFPDDLKEITFNYNNEENYFKSLSLPCSGKELYEWASAVEKKVYSTIDSFLPMEEIQAEGHDELFGFSVLKSEYLTIEGQQIPGKILFTLDDTHKLSAQQRQALKKYVIEKRGSFNIWIAERLEALEPQENLGSYIERDYEELNLEKFWSDRPKKFENILSSIASKRASISTDDVNSFQEYLDSYINEEANKDRLLKILNATEQELLRLTSNTNLFDDWIAYIRSFDANPIEKALLYKKALILIHRNLGRAQLALGFPLAEQELIEKINKSDIEGAARLFLSNDSSLPYYFGFPMLSRLSSNNIEQFLSFAAELFEEMLSHKISGDQVHLSPEDQEKILRTTVENKWNELSRIVPYASNVVKFLKELGEFCQKETNKPNAPYAPGVNGFSIKPPASKLIEEGPWTSNELYDTLVNVISTCVAYNLIEIKEVNQGEKGQRWDVYYLNRWLCLKFNLPFSYGGFRHKTPDELLKWCKL
jgi:hypothetical protein